MKKFRDAQTLEFQDGSFDENLEKSDAKKLPMIVYFHPVGLSGNSKLLETILLNR